MSFALSGWATLTAWRIFFTIAALGTLSSTIFLFLVLRAARRFHQRAASSRASIDSIQTSSFPAVTILKPVHGMEPRLAENLETFFQQDYPDFEIVIGARDEADPALQVAQRVCAKFPHVKSRIVLSGPPAWPNAKVYSLSRMIASSVNDYFVISDSDVQVSRDFVRNVIAPLLDPAVGLVTCPYRGVPASGLWSRLEALGMSVEMPSGVLVADMMEGMRFAMGAVMATRRDALDKIGGIASTAGYYSDDFVLGREVWASGYRVVLSHQIVGHVLFPRSFRQSFGDQLRWMKSTRFSRPAGHLGTGLTFAMPFGLLGFFSAAALGRAGSGLAFLLVAVLNRALQAVAVGYGIIGDHNALRYCWLYPLRDLLGFCTWIGSFTSRHFFWRGETYRFGEQGRIIPQERGSENVLATQP
jgi:ceramide glucosyltransferase